MLQQWHHFDHAHVVKKFVVLLLILAVKNQVGPEHKDRGGEDRDDLQGLEADDPVPEQVDLVDLEHANEAEHDPWEDCLQRRDIQLTQMVAHLRLICQQQLLKKLAQTHDALRVTRERVEMTEVLAVQSPEYEVAILLLLRNETDRGEVCGESLDRYDSIRWVGTHNLVRSTHTKHRRIRLGLHKVQHLSVSEEEEHALLNHILKDEVLVIIALDHDVRVDQVVDRRLKFVELVLKIGEVVDVFLGDVCVQDFLVDSTSQCGRDSSLSVLDEIWLIVLLEKSLSDDDPLIYKAFLLVDTDLSESDIEIVELLPQLYH